MKMLTAKELKLLKQNFEPVTFNNFFILVHEKQVPSTCIILLNGKLEFLKHKKVEKFIEPGILLGVSHLIHNNPVKFDWKITDGSEVILIQKTDILEILEDKESDLYPIFASRMAIINY